MKLSISNIAWDTKFNDDVYQILQENNFTGLEIAPTKIFANLPYENLNEAKIWANQLNSKYHLEISSMQSIWYGRTEKIFGSNEERQSLIDYTKKAIDFASVIGCKNLVFGCPKNRNINSESDYAIAIEFFKELGDYAITQNTVIGMEANPKIYNTNFINDTLSAIKLIKDVHSEGFKLNLDIGTMIENSEPSNELVGNVALINHVHISEPYLKQITKRELHNEIISILNTENYSGYISIEMSQQDNLEDINNVVTYVRELL